jgi:hypothetical protein
MNDPVKEKVINLVTHLKTASHLLGLVIMSMVWDYVYELWPPAVLLFVPKMTYEYGEPRWNDIDRVIPKNLEKILFQFHFVQHKSQ